MNYYPAAYPHSVNALEFEFIEPSWRLQVQRILGLSETVSSNEREKFIKLWEPYERIVEALYYRGMLSQEEQEQVCYPYPYIVFFHRLNIGFQYRQLTLGTGTSRIGDTPV
jgi:hypothetical protein